MRAQLIPVDGGPPVPITKDLIVVGRKSDCDLRLKHRGVSKHHCVLVRTDGLLLLRDLGSTNGTRVNGQRVRRAALLPNDQLQIATFTFRVALGPAESGVKYDRTEEMSVEDLPGDADSHTERVTSKKNRKQKAAAKAKPLPKEHSAVEDEDDEPDDSDLI